MSATNKILLILFIIISLLMIAGCKKEASGDNTQIPNPASVYCIEHGGRLDIREGEGGQYGVCMFNGGSECEEWQYYRGECSKGATTTTQPAPPPLPSFCENKCGDGTCQEIVCMSIGCPCAETRESCPQDCK